MKKYYFFAILIYLLIAACFSIYMSDFISNMVFAGDDDMFASFRPDFNESLFSKLLHVENGRYIINGLLYLFVVFIPHLFNIHLNDFYNSFGAVFFLIIVQLACLTASSVYILLNKDNKNILLSGIIVLNGMGMILLYIVNNVWNVYGMQSCNTYYGYLLAPFSGFLFLYILYRYILTKENNPSPPQKKSVILYSLLGLCAGCSSQIIAEIVAVTIFLLIFYGLVTNKITLKKLIKEKTIIIPIFTFIFGIIIMVLSPGFWIQVAWRHLESFSQLKEIFIPFCKEYLYFVIYKNILFYIVTIILWLLILIHAYKNNCIKKALDFILITSFPLIGILTFYFLLILGGSGINIDGGEFWVQEPFYLLPYYLVFQFIIASNIGYIVKKIKNIYIKYSVVLFIPLIIFSYFLRNEEKFKAGIIGLSDYRKSVYTCEKIYVIQLYQNKNTVILPSFCDNYHIFTRFDEYLKNHYKLPENTNVIAVDDFEKTIGYKTDEVVNEKELKKVKFQKLLDKDYVLNSIEHEI